MTNEQLKQYTFLAEMLRDPYFPPNLVAKGQQILIELCETIESRKPRDLDSLYAITQAATEEFNTLGEEFEARHLGYVPDFDLPMAGRNFYIQARHSL